MQNNVTDKARLDYEEDVDRIQDWINAAYYTACIETNFFEASSSATALAANATSATVPSSIVKIEYIVPTGSDGSVWGPMTETNMEEILKVRAYQGGQTSTGAPSRYAYRSSSAPTIEFWPNAGGGEVLTFYGLKLPTALSADADLPIFPEPYSKVIEYGALVHAAEFQKDMLTVQQFQAQYDMWLQRFRGFNNVRVGSMVQQFQVEGQRPWPKANSVDQGY